MERDVFCFDVYGQFRVMLHQGDDGWWIAERVGEDGKRQALPEVVAPPETDPDRIADHLEAMFHEAGRPGARIVRLPSD